MLMNACRANHHRDSQRQIGSEQVGCFGSATQSAPHKNSKQAQNHEGPNQTEFLANHSEYEIRMRFRQIEELLLSLHVTDAVNSACSHRYQRLNNLIPAVERDLTRDP